MRGSGASVSGFSLAVHLFERHFGDAVLAMLIDHSADGAFLLHHLVVAVSETGQPRLVPTQLAVANQRVICEGKTLLKNFGKLST